MENNRIDWVDNLRGLAMFAILLAHTSASFILGFYEQWPFYDRYAQPIYLILLLYLQSVLPPFFFILSGYLAARCLDNQSQRHYMGKRLWRIGLPFLIGMILFVLPSEALYMIGQLFPPSFWHQQQGLPTAQIWQNLHAILAQYSWPSLLKYFDNTQVYWFLYYLLIFECLAGAMKYLLTLKQSALGNLLLKWHSPLFIYGGLPVVIALVFTFGFPTPQHLSLATPISFVPDVTSILEFALMYLIGMGCYLYPKLLDQLSVNFDIRILLGITFGFYFFYLGYLSPISYFNFWAGKATWFSYNFFLWSVLLGTTAGFYQHLNQPNQVCRYLADAAYWIYFIHLPLIIPWQGYLAPLQINPIFKYPLLLLGATVIVLLPYHLFVRPFGKR